MNSKPAFFPKTRFLSGFTMLELLVVVAIILVILSFAYTTYIRAQSNQALSASSERLADTLRQAHVFAREAKDKKGWGVRRESETTYSLVSITLSSTKVEKSFSVESTVNLPEQFFVKFDIGTGTTPEDSSIFIANKYGKRMQISVLKSGVVEVNLIN